MQAALGGNGLGQRLARIGFFEERLPLQIGRFDKIPVNDAQAAKPGARQQPSLRCA